MKHFIKILFSFFFCLPLFLNAQQVTYKMAYDGPSQTYTVSMKSNTTYNPPLSRLSSSVQFTVVAPHVAGGWQVTNLTALTALGWGVTVLEGTSTVPPIPANDYLFFAPTNAGTYSPFIIPANTYIDLFTFKSGSGCVGNLALYDNATDPLNGIPSINGDNNMVILGAGPGNIYFGNDSGSVACAPPPPICTAEAGTLSY